MTMNLIHEEYKPIEGKFAVFIMSFNGDTPCLEQCLRGIEEQIKKGYNIEIFICDDGLTPITDEEILQNYNYTKSYFNRNGNLNGSECSIGMLIEMLKAARQSRAEYILKVDSDMYIKNLERFLSPLKENPNQVIGFKLSSTMNYAAGVTYILPTIGLYPSIRHFYSWLKNEKENDEKFISHCPEDWAITRCTAAVNDFTLTLWDNSDKQHPEQWLLSPFNYKEIRTDGSIPALCMARYQLYDFINFGNRHEIKLPNPRQVAGETMKKFVNFDLNNEFLLDIEDQEL